MLILLEFDPYLELVFCFLVFFRNCTFEFRGRIKKTYRSF
jgi:hypothetical protein